MYVELQTTDKHEASRGLSATAERLVETNTHYTDGFPSLIFLNILS